MGERKLPSLEYRHSSSGDNKGGRINLDDRGRLQQLLVDTGRRPLVVVNDMLMENGNRLTGFTSHKEIPVRHADIVLVSIEQGVKQAQIEEEMQRLKDFTHGARRAQVIVNMPVSEDSSRRIQSLSQGLSAQPEHILRYQYDGMTGEVIRFTVGKESVRKRKAA